MQLKSLSLPVYGPGPQDFARLRGARVLIYFPHGIGDWAQFAYVLPLLEASNIYWMTRYGDDFVALIDGCAFAEPAYTGVSNPHNDFGGSFGNRHFGIRDASENRHPRRLRLPAPLSELCSRERVDALLWEPFPETRGNAPYPFHSKARHALRGLVGEERNRTLNLDAPLKSSLSFRVSPTIRGHVEARLRRAVGTGRKLCLIARNGYTSTEKNWGHAYRHELPKHKRREGEECRDFMRLLRAKDPRWSFVTIEDRMFEGDDTVRSAELHAHSYADLFEDSAHAALPFGLVVKVLVSLADLCVGVPTGPFHISMGHPELPTVGIWIEHLPSWYEEPKVASVHVIGRNAQRHLGRQPGSFIAEGALQFRTLLAQTRFIPGEQVLGAVEMLL